MGTRADNLPAATAKVAQLMKGPRPIALMLQGALLDPFGHMWLIGKILE